MSVKDNIQAELLERAKAFERLLTEAIDRSYRAGFVDGLQSGADRMRESILRAAQAPLLNENQSEGIGNSDESASVDNLIQQNRRKSGQGGRRVRAPRGSVRAAIVAALTAKPGSYEQDVGTLANQFDPLVSPRSVGGELRRLKGRLYRQQGSQWFLMGERFQTELPTITETAEPESPAVSQPQATQEDSDASETAIAA